MSDADPQPDSAPDSAPDSERIAKYLARAGVASRRDIEAMIGEGRIYVDGARLDTPAFKVTGREKITVDGQPVAAPQRTRLWRYHKPAGLVTTNRDPEGRPTVFEHLPPNLPRVVTIGRLDLNTEGLLLLTNDGELARALELPATGLKRTYRARAFGGVKQSDLDRLRDGIEYEGVQYRAIIATLERSTGRNTWIEMTLTEGKKREARRALESLGLQVNRLIRTSYGPITLDDLPVGEIDVVPNREMYAAFGHLLGDAPPPERPQENTRTPRIETRGDPRPKPQQPKPRQRKPVPRRSDRATTPPRGTLETQDPRKAKPAERPKRSRPPPEVRRGSAPRNGPPGKGPSGKGPSGKGPQRRGPAR
jgi:23S rRNA pseudouridine2605 synthase